MWHEITHGDVGGLAAYKTVLDTEGAYNGTAIEGLRKQHARPGVTMWHYDGPQQKQALCIHVRPDGTAKIVAGVVHGPALANAEHFCRVMITKIRSHLDPLGIRAFHAEQPDTYTSADMTRFAAAIGHVCHEYEADTYRVNSAGKRKRAIVFDRKPQNKHKDNDFRGKLKP